MRGIFRDVKDAPVIWGAVLMMLTAVQCMTGTVLVMLSDARLAMAVPSLHARAAIFHMELSGPAAQRHRRRAA